MSSVPATSPPARTKIAGCGWRSAITKAAAQLGHDHSSHATVLSVSTACRTGWPEIDSRGRWRTRAIEDRKIKGLAQEPIPSCSTRPIPRRSDNIGLVQVHVSLIGRKELSGEIYRQLRPAIVDGRLRPGEPLPASRELARGLNVSRTTVTFAYDRLAGEGFVTARVGAGTFVNEHGAPAPNETKRR